MYTPFRQHDHGFITLMSVLIVGAIGVASTVSLILLGLGSSRTSFALEQSYQAKTLANTCAEEALQQIQGTPTFTGSASITLGHGTCTYTITNQGGENRIISSSATVGTIVSKMEVTIDTITPVIHVTTWQEVNQF